MKDVYLEGIQKHVFSTLENSDSFNSEYIDNAKKAIGNLGFALSKIKHIDEKTRKSLAKDIKDALSYLNNKPESNNALSSYLGTNPKNYRTKS